MFIRSLRCAISLGVSLFSVALWAKTTTLTVVDGQKWSAGTWDNGLPEDGDIVVVSNGTSAAATTVNDLVTSLTRIDFKGLEATSDITLEGNGLSLSGDTKTTKRYIGNVINFPLALDLCTKVIFNVELTASADSCWYGENKAQLAGTTFNRDIHIADGKTLVFYAEYNGADYFFNGRVQAPNATFAPFPYHRYMTFNAPIDVGVLNCRAVDNTGELKLAARGNRIGQLINYGMTVTPAFDAFETAHDIEQAGTGESVYRPYGSTIGGIQTTKTTAGKNFRFYPVWGGTLYFTLAPTHDCCATNCLLGFYQENASYHKVAVTFDSPNGSTQEIFSESGTGTYTPGPLTVNRGTLRATGLMSYPILTTLNIRGGAFSTASTYAGTMFPKLTTLVVGATGTFAVEAEATATILAPGMTDLILAPGGKISVAAGKSLTFKSVSYGGAQLAAGTYTSATAEWIAGDGSVTVAAAAASADYWSAAASGVWTDATKWSKGSAPAASDTAYVTAAGADFTVSVPSGMTMPASAVVRNDGTHATTLDFEDGTVLSGLKMTLGYGTKGEIAGGETVTLGGGSLTLEDGGSLKVAAGGALVWSSAGSIRLVEGARFDSAGDLDLGSGTTILAGGDSSLVPSGCSTSVVAIAGGTVINKSGIAVGPCARLELSGDAVVTNAVGANAIVRTTGGVIDVSGHAVIDCGPTWCFNLLDGNGSFGSVVFRDYARWTSYDFYDSPGAKHNASRIYWGGNSQSVAFRGHASFELPFASEWTVRNGSVNFVYDSDATSSSGARLDMSIPNGNTPGGDHTATFKRGLVLFNGGFHIGGYAAYNKDGTSSGTSHVYVDGGAISPQGGNASWRYFSACSLCLGDGDHADAATERTPTVQGFLHLVSGSVTNRAGAVRLGSGRGVGTIIQTGGEFVNLEAENNDECPMVVGAFNATGVYTLSNGLHTAKCDVYVGGANMSQIGGKIESWQDQGFLNLHDAYGTLTVAAADLTKPCSFTTEKDLNFGADGNGVLRLGEAGSVTAANVTFWNGNTDVTNHSSKVFCTLGASGAACLTATNAVTVQPGTKLTVDATKFAGDKKVWLVKAAEMKGTFDATIVGGKGTDSIVQTSKGVVFKRSLGLVILVR